MGRLSERDKHAVVMSLNDMQMTESINTYNNLVERCFSECIVSFRNKALEDSEQVCVKRCVRKFMTFSQRVAIQFQAAQHRMSR